MLSIIPDWLISDKLKSEVISYAHAKTLVGMFVIGLIVAPYFCYLYFSAGFYKLALLVGIDGILILGLLVSLKYVRSVFLPREIFIFSIIVSFYLVALILGGIFSPSIFWLVITPIICVIAGGFYTGIFWCFLVTLLLISLLQTGDHNFVQLQKSPDFALIIGSSRVLLTLVIFIIVFLSEREKVLALEAHYRAYYDPVTNTLNQYAFEDQLNKKKHAQKHPIKNLILVKLSVNSFHAISEALGFEAGDALLKQVANRIKAFAPTSSLIARASSDAFLMTIENIEYLKAIEVINLLSQKLKEPYQLDQHGHVIINCSFGYAALPNNTTQLPRLFQYSHLA